MNLSRRMLSALMAAACMAVLTACGGGGGGGGSVTLKGTILLLSTGNPVTGATVSALGSSFTTVADGTFTLTNVSPSATQLTVTATGAKPLTQPLPTLTSGETLNLGNIYLVDSTDTTNGYTANVSGVVERGDNHNPVAGAQVVISGQVAITGADGSFAFTHVPSGIGGNSTPIGLATPPAGSGLLNVATPIVTEFPLAVGNNNPLLVILPPPVSSQIPGVPADISGTISLQGLTDLSGTTVNLLNKATGTIVVTETTGASGAYGFYVAGGQYTVQAVHTGYTTQSKDVTLVSP